MCHNQATDFLKLPAIYIVELLNIFAGNAQRPIVTALLDPAIGQIVAQGVTRYDILSILMIAYLRFDRLNDCIIFGPLLLFGVPGR